MCGPGLSAGRPAARNLTMLPYRILHRLTAGNILLPGIINQLCNHEKIATGEKYLPFKKYRGNGSICGRGRDGSERAAEMPSRLLPGQPRYPPYTHPCLNPLQPELTKKLTI